MTGNDIRKKFLEYFENRGHTVVRSSSLVPTDDPSLMFTNAGMNQFKDLFLGNKTASYTTAATCQKVVRAGGKHNDLENVGKTARHHTFFEMLGNFSFGDYFKEDAIRYGWDFLTNVLKIDEAKLYVTVYEEDDDAYRIWNEVIGLPPSKIVRSGAKDNFWQMGDTGPCGPCSEIHMDRGEDYKLQNHQHLDPEESAGDRYLELWNLVFMQYDRDENGNLTPLPQPSIDTGMGLERVASAIQDVPTNYDTDLFIPIIDYISDITGKSYDDQANAASLRVIADHARGVTFLISDGVIPSNEGRGYVLRRIIRRALRHGKMLGFDEIFFHKVCKFVANSMKSHYSELGGREDYIANIVEAEEKSFDKTLTSGLKRIDELISQSTTDVISGEKAFKLYDSYGFPLDLLEDILRDAGFTIDMVQFQEHLDAQRAKGRESWIGNSRDDNQLYLELEKELNTSWQDVRENQTKLRAIICDGASVPEIGEGSEAEIVLDVTPFYPEGGGQVGDSGVISSGDATFEVKNTYTQGSSLIVHRGFLRSGTLRVDSDATCSIDTSKRRATQKNHTATHILHKALQNNIGSHVRQSGSSVNHERLRFDFNHSEAIPVETIGKIEQEVNKVVQSCTSVSSLQTSLDEALNMGAMAIFGEKYGEEVRLVNVGDYSLELCGGCHVGNTGEIGLIKITAETSVAVGTRRIEAITGEYALSALNEYYNTQKDVANMLNIRPQELEDKVSEMLETQKTQAKTISNLMQQINSMKSNDALSSAVTVSGVKVLSVKANQTDAASLKNYVDTLRDKISSGIVVAGMADGKKVTFICGVTEDITDRISAGDIVKEVSAIAGGKGGGKDDFGMGGGKEPEKLDKALEETYGIVEKLLK